MKRIVSAYIEAEHLLRPHDTVLIALSGGADSVALLRVLLALGYPVEAAHCNFHLRGDESDRDEQFVRRLCQEHRVPLHVTHFDTAAYAAAHSLSIEMAAREQRYAWFQALRQERGAAAVAVAHHRDDSVETMLLNLVRGTGLHGLTGIAPRNGHIIRPLLSVSRADILHYLQQLGQSYVTDSTNLQDAYRRNKIRLRVLPLLEELNPSIAQTLADTASRLRQAEALYQSGIDAGVERVLREDGTGKVLSIPALLAEPSPRALLHEILHPLGFHSAQEEDIYGSISRESGRRFTAHQWEVLRDRDAFLIRRLDDATAALQALPPRLQIQEHAVTPDYVLPRDKHVACLDADLLVQPLTVRRPRPADRFVPFGMKGKKLLSDYFTDRKYSAYRKQQQWVVCSGEDIVWLVDERPDGRYCVTGQTKRVVEIRVKGD
jgi:tRNA(Ile)-lysidine synthase